MLPILMSGNLRDGDVTVDPETPASSYAYPEFPSAYAVTNGGELYNVQTPCVTPTDDGTGHAIHPDGIAFDQPWNGHCFWHAATAYFNAEDVRENPHVYYSDDGHTWNVPPGVTNPIDPWPGAATSDVTNYNSDTDLTYNPETDELIVTWREVKGNEQIIWGSKSSTGSNWSAPFHLVTALKDPDYSSVSQSLTRVSANEWRLYFASGNAPGKERFISAPTPEGPWDNSDSTPVIYTGAATSPYHGDVIYHEGVYYSLFCTGGYEYPGISYDGINFTVKAPILAAVGGTPETNQNMYRSGIQPHHNGTHMHVWYTSHAVGGRHCYYTVVRLDRWTD